MDIDRLDDKRVLITFEQGEFDFLFSYNSGIMGEKNYSPPLFFGLLTLAAVKSGISLSGKRMTVNYLTGSFHSFIILTITSQKYLPTARSVTVIAEFPDYYTLTTAITRIPLRNGNIVFHSELLTMWKTPLLLLAVSRDHVRNIINILCEYSSVRICSPLNIAHIKEFGAVIAADNDLLNLYDSLCDK